MYFKFNFQYQTSRVRQTNFRFSPGPLVDDATDYRTNMINYFKYVMIIYTNYSCHYIRIDLKGSYAQIE